MIGTNFLTSLREKLQVVGKEFETRAGLKKIIAAELCRACILWAGQGFQFSKIRPKISEHLLLLISTPLNITEIFRYR